MSSLSLASASSQYAQLVPGNLNVQGMSCFFRTTTAAAQMLMYAERFLSGSIRRSAKLVLATTGITVQPMLELYSSTGPTIHQVVSSGSIAIAANLWNFAAGWWDDAGGMGVILCRGEGPAYSYEDTFGSVTFTLNPTGRYVIGSTYAGGTYMNGQISHAMIWGSPMTLGMCESIAYGRYAPQVSSSYYGVANDSLLYHFPLNSNYDNLYGANATLTPVNSPTWSTADPNACEAVYQELVL